MNLFECDLGQVLLGIVNLYTIVLLIYAVLSWIPDLRGNRFERLLGTIIDPLLAPLRRIIPPIGGFDIAFLVLLLLLQFLVRPFLIGIIDNACVVL